MFKDMFDDDEELPLWAIVLLVLGPVLVLVFLLVNNQNRKRMSRSAGQSFEFTLEQAPTAEVPLQRRAVEEPQPAPAEEPQPAAAEAPATGETGTPPETAAQAMQQAAQEQVVEEPAVQVEPGTLGQNEPLDDLKVIEGIGPKIQEIFYGAGIKNYRQLADTPVDKLREVLAVAHIPGDPTTWPEQAKLAAEGRLDDLVNLQKELKGGRRVE